MKEKIPSNLVVTIDGPSGAGKSTVAKMLARTLHYVYIDTGAMYRGVAWAYKRWREERRADKRGQKTQERGQNGKDSIEKTEQGLSEEMTLFLKDLDTSLQFEFGAETRVFLDGQDISAAIRAPDISLLASRLSQDPRVRSRLYEMQRLAGRRGGVVLEGRDTGSVVFPNAHVKFYLDADPGVRARRRYLELSGKGAGPDLTTVEQEMIRRDRDDSERSVAPLRVPEGALRIDTTGLSLDGVVEVLLKHVVRQGAIWK